jgi:RNA polymerase sigma-70 factor, ECF subfamily
MCEGVTQANFMAEKLLPDNFSEKSATVFSNLVERVKAGDTTAFDQIMIYSQRRVISLAWRMLGNEDDARDATQETFLRVYKYLNSYKKEQDFFAWVYRITVNVCHDIAKKQRTLRGQVTSIDSEVESGTFDFPADEANAEDAIVVRQQREIVADAIKTLPERERVAIVLRDIEGLSTEEVARIMKSSPTTVRVQISSARKKLKHYCDRYFGKGTEKDL